MAQDTVGHKTRRRRTAQNHLRRWSATTCGVRAGIVSGIRVIAHTLNYKQKGGSVCNHGAATCNHGAATCPGEDHCWAAQLMNEPNQHGSGSLALPTTNQQSRTEKSLTAVWKRNDRRRAGQPFHYPITDHHGQTNQSFATESSPDSTSAPVTVAPLAKARLVA